MVRVRLEGGACFDALPSRLGMLLEGQWRKVEDHEIYTKNCVEK